MNQILINLFKNAVKFTNNGKIEFGYQSNEPGKLTFFIKDTGIGIKKEDLTKLFEQFAQLDSISDRRVGGTGLGLSIVKHIIELHGGTVGVESAEGAGSKFWFTIPK